MTIDPNETVETYCRNWDGVTPYARATIVHTRGATAAKAGAKAVVTSDGELVGWIGGGCLRGAILRAAREAIDTGAPRLIRVRPKAETIAPLDNDGIPLYASGCPGNGGADVFIEPVLPKPSLIIIGASQVAQAVADLAAGLSFELIRTEPDKATAELRALSNEPRLDRSFIVIATQGAGDHVALKSALETNAPYVAFVASRAKAAALRERLTAEGISEAAFARLRAPAGLQISGKTPSEIAIAILAEIISVHRAADPEIHS
jgi:xanthine dehydrogenase accessory factor